MKQFIFTLFLFLVMAILIYLITGEIYNDFKNKKDVKIVFNNELSDFNKYVVEINEKAKSLESENFVKSFIFVFSSVIAILFLLKIIEMKK